MKNQGLYLSIGLMLLIALITGCEQSTLKSDTPLVESSSSPTSTATQVITSIPIPTIIPTAIPTLEMEQARVRLLQLLSTNGNCRLPCVWGITPGKTTPREAENILFPLSNISWLIRLDTSPGTFEAEYKENDNYLLTDITYLFNDNIISDIAFESREFKNMISPDGETYDARSFDSGTFTKRIQPYSLQGVLTELGQPEAVLIQTRNEKIYFDFEIILFYPDKGVFIVYSTQNQFEDNKIYGCPIGAHVEMRLFPPGQGDTLPHYLMYTKWEGIWPIHDNDPYWKPIQEATGLSLERFYEIFKKPTKECIVTPTNIWHKTER